MNIIGIMVKTFFIIGVLSVFLTSQSAIAHGGINRFSFGIQYGYPGFYGYNFYDPFIDPFFYPPVVVPVTPPVIVSTPPPVYIDQPTEPATRPIQKNYWYYCQEPDGYYPYVKQCPGGWQQVNPSPPIQP